MKRRNVLSSSAFKLAKLAKQYIVHRLFPRCSCNAEAESANLMYKHFSYSCQPPAEPQPQIVSAKGSWRFSVNSTPLGLSTVRALTPEPAFCCNMNRQHEVLLQGASVLSSSSFEYITHHLANPCSEAGFLGGRS